ncbi:Aminotransferase-like, plant mobile domain [Sesbania bispinosa]|nr:Aminotransferase-like, plant mobile domain [Sesbania bispinosa]
MVDQNWLVEGISRNTNTDSCPDKGVRTALRKQQTMVSGQSMVKKGGARGEDGSPSRGRGDAQERIRPTASARARKGRQVEQPVQQDDPSPIEEVRNRGTLKVITHGRKLRRAQNDYVRDIVDDSGLGPLVEGTHSLVDKSLLSAFVERWHKDTSNFHLPVGEMTITLDDVNNLLHILVHGRFFFLPSLGKDEAKELLVTLLGVSYSDAHEEIEYTRCPSVRLSWLRTVYENMVEENRLTYAARAYLLHLVGCTIFTDKSASNVRVQYLEMFRVLAAVGHIAWGAVALAYLYEQLNEASLHQTRQLAGYSTLFQAWILEHFSHVTHGERSPDNVEGMPLSRRLRPHRPVGDVVNVRQYLDRIRYSDIIWTPYITHRAYRPFYDVCWYYGYITSGGAPLPHLPDRVMRQYGHVQSIPPSPHEELPVPPSADVHAHFIHYHDHLLDESRRGPLVTHAGEVHDPLPRRVPTVGGRQDIPSGTPEDSSHPALFAGIMERLQALLSTDMCVPGSDGEMLTHEMLRMAQLGQQYECKRITSTYQRKRRGGGGSTS